MATPADMPSRPQRRLNSWKEIARFFQRDERTVKRWELDRGLPVHRIPGEGRSKIYAEPEELEAWLKQGSTARRPHGDPSSLAGGRVSRLRWPPLLVAAAAAVLVVVAGTAAYVASGTVGRRPPGSSDPVAAELYRQGMHDWDSRTAAGLKQATDEFTQAIVRDPASADAYVGLAKTYALLREYSDLPDSEAYPRARAAAQRALKIDPRSGGAYAALSFVDFYYDWNVVQAERDIRAAIRLAPQDATNHLWYANMLKLQRRFDEALRQIQDAEGLSSASSSVMADKADILASMGRTADAEALLQKVETAEPQQMWAHADLASLAFTQRNYAYFLKEARLANAIRGDDARTKVLAAGESGLREGGGKGMLEGMLGAEKALLEEGRGSPYAAACISVQLGREAEALAWLHAAVDRRDAAILGTLSDNCLAPLRASDDLAFVRRIVMGPGSRST